MISPGAFSRQYTTTKPISPVLATSTRKRASGPRAPLAVGGDHARVEASVAMAPPQSTPTDEFSDVLSRLQASVFGTGEV